MSETRSGKVAIVTGSTRGIGRGVADALWESGYQVIYSGTGEIPPSDLPGGRQYIQCRIEREALRAQLIDETIARYGRLDVLVNNAGVAPEKRMDILETTEESFDRVVGINMRGTFFLCQRAANAMLRLKEQLGGGYTPRIINITSISAYASSQNRAEYCIAKAGLSMATQVFAARLAPEGIPVFEIRPGIIETDMTSAVRDKYQAMIEGGLTPVPRMGKPRDVADMVLAVCSGLLDFSAGQVLDADGGFHLRRL